MLDEIWAFIRGRNRVMQNEGEKTALGFDIPRI